MHIKFLGTGTGLPELGKKHSCLFVNQGNITYLLDCGEGVSQAFLENNFHQDKIDFIVITHYHPDHITGIYMLLQMFYLKKRTKELNIFLPENIDFFKESLNAFYLFSERMTYRIKISDITSLNNTYPNISIIKNDHLTGYKNFIEKNNLSNPMNSFSIKIKDEKTTVYSSDISSVESIKDFIKGIDYCIIDGIHTNINDIIKLKESIKEKIFLTHCQKDCYKDLTKTEDKFEVAQENKTYSFI